MGSPVDMNLDRAQVPKKVLIHIRSLQIGGSERQVVSLAKAMAALGNEIHVATIANGGPLESELSGMPHVRIHSLGGAGLTGKLRYLCRLHSLIRKYRFDAVYGFLPSPNLALLVARTVRHRPLIAWGVRSSNLDLNQYRGRVKWAMRLEKLLSRYSDRIITNSQAALAEYDQKGYPHSKLIHIPNAIETDRFKPDQVVRGSVRDELNISEGTPLIGLFARLHPMKDHATFLRAAMILVETNPQVRFICAGGTSDEYSNYEKRTKASATTMGLDENVLWLGPRNDPERLMAACDITTLTSENGEGFPNSVAESMACGVPCVVTDVGDAATIVSEHSAVVPRGDFKGLAQAWNIAIDQDQATKDQIAVAMRRSIVDRYSTHAIALKTLVALRR